MKATIVGKTCKSCAVLAYDFEEKGLTDFLQNLALVSDQDTHAC
jgi:hypothetical protein